MLNLVYFPAESKPKAEAIFESYQRGTEGLPKAYLRLSCGPVNTGGERVGVSVQGSGTPGRVGRGSMHDPGGR